MTKRFDKCIIHIGAEKTGTSTIQRFLSDNRKALLKDGIFHPNLKGPTHGSQWEFVTISHNKPWDMDVGKECGVFDADDQEKFAKALEKDLNQQFESAKKASTLLISSEHLQSRLHTPEEIGRLKSFLEKWVDSFQIIVFIRRQDELAVSHFTTRVKNGFQGQKLRLPENPAKILFYRYDKLYNRWAKIFGEQSIKVHLYGSHFFLEDSLLKQFCKSCNIKFSNKTEPDSINNSVNAKGLKFIQSINRYFVDNYGDHNHEIRNELILLITELCRGKFYPIGRSRAEQFYSHFSESNERLRAKVFPGKPGPLFNNDFSMYPELPEEMSEEYSDAVDIMIQLWGRRKEESRIRKAAQSVSNLFKRSSAS